MHRLWLIFAQAVTVSVAALFVVATLKPEWLGGRPAPAVVSLQEAAAPAAAAGPDARRAGSYAEAAKKALPSVVHIYTSKEVKAPRHPFADDPVFRYFFGDRFGGPQRQSGLGSGVIVSAEGYILTNNHVVENMDEIEVATNDGRRLRGRVVGTDPETDLAVLQVKAEGKLAAITFATTESLHVGDVVLAIGNPFGVGQSVTFGIIGATGRAGLGLSTFENFIQTDAAIHPGNSGGALVNAEGRLVGINSAVYSQQGGGSLGIGFAIPAAVAYQVMQALIDHGRVVRGWLGIEVERVELPGAATARIEGLRVTAVVSGSPAEQAGIAENDIITRLSGRESWNGRLAMEQIARARPGEQVRISVLRGSEPMELTATVGERPPAEP